MSTDGVWLGDVANPEYEPYEAGRVFWLRRDIIDGRELWAGIWEVGPDDMEPGALHESTHDETFHVLEGAVRIEIVDGPTLELRAGSVASLRRGTRARWTVLEPLREFFVYV
jgi:uncharacterized cupin superfamily protein